MTIVGDHCTFFRNQTHNGGAIYMYANNSKLNIQSQTLLVVNNTARATGGTLIFTFPTLLSHFTVEIRNRGKHGGALFATGRRIEIQIKSKLIYRQQFFNRKWWWYAFVSMPSCLLQWYE